MTFNIDELLILLAWEARLISIEDACAALGITRRELIAWESDAAGEGCKLARERAAA